MGTLAQGRFDTGRPAVARRPRPVLRYLEGWVLLFLLLVLLVVLWDWNWFKPLAERQASEALGREVTIGNIGLDLGEHPRLVLDDLAIGNPEEFTAQPTMLRVKQLAVRADLLGFFHHRVFLDEVTIDRADGNLGRGPSGTPNWAFERLQKSAPPDPAAQPWQVEVARLAVKPSRIHIVDPQFKSDFTLDVRTENPPEGGEEHIVVDIDGLYSGQPIKGRFTGGSALTLRDESKPYPVDLALANGATRVRANGTLLRPLEFGGANVKITFEGNNLADLFPLTAIPLPDTKPYSLKGQLDYTEARIRFRDFLGRVGDSDLSGTVSVDPHRARPFVKADLHSKQVLFADLGGLIGATPGEADKTDPEELKRQRAAAAARPRVLPDTPINLPKMRAADLDVHYVVDRIVSDSMPFDNMDVALGIENGNIRLKPLQFHVGEGRVIANVALDAGDDDVVRSRADIDFRKIDMSKVLDKMGVHKGEGLLGGRAVINTSGNSVASSLGRGDGSLQLYMAGGDISALIVDLAGLDFGNALLSAIGVPSRTKLRCMVADVDLKKGQASAKTFLVDTTEANIVVTGGANLANETLDMQLKTHPKSLNLLALRAPIDIDGTFKNPKVFPDTGELVKRGGAAVALGVLFTPLAALIPTLQLGLGEDTDCGSVLADVQASPAKAPAAPPPKKP